MKEREILLHFKSCNAFRDMFYLTNEMVDWIVLNTVPLSDDLLRPSERQREYARKYRDSADSREYQRLYGQKYRSTPEYREYNRKRQRDYQRKKRLEKNGKDFENQLKMF